MKRPSHKTLSSGAVLAVGSMQMIPDLARGKKAESHQHNAMRQERCRQGAGG
ncbi:MAG TPA: hypothetical protein VHV83_19185 [Armatimonadota bacterium]|nr:hypothetical protein [Armatimonadota bacterium]